MSADEKSIELAISAGLAAKSKKAEEVIALDVSERLILTDMFVLATGSNERQVRAIVDAVDEAMSKHGVKLLRREGLQEARWVLLDYGSIVVHVQHEEDRQFYALERLWADAPIVEIPEEDLVQSAGSSPAEGAAEASPTPDVAEPTPISPLDLIGEDD